MRKLLYFLILFTLFSSCDKENIDNNDIESSQPRLIRGNLKAFKGLDRLINLTVMQQRKLLGKSNNNLYDFSIDSTSVTQITFEDDVYYTFAISRKNEINYSFENLVICDKIDSEPTAYIMKYTPDEDYLNRLIDDSSTFFSGDKSIISLDYNRLITSSGGCFTVSTTYCNYEAHENNELGPGVAGPACSDTYTVTQTVCFDINDDPFIDAGPSSGGGGGSGSAGSTGSESNNNGNEELTESDIITIPDVILGGPNMNWSEEVILYENPPGDEIGDLNAYFAPFDLTKSALFTLYTDQPIPHNDDSWVDTDPTWLGVDPDVGHTFISIQQGTITRLIGFYPKNGVRPMTNPKSVGVFIEDSDHSFDVSVSKPITSAQLSKIISETKLFINNDYDLNTNNCTDYGLNMARKAGISNIGSCYGTWPGGGGDNPGALGQKLRSLGLAGGMTRNASGGKSPLNSN